MLWNSPYLCVLNAGLFFLCKMLIESIPLFYYVVHLVWRKCFDPCCFTKEVLMLLVRASCAIRLVILLHWEIFLMASHRRK